MNEIKMKRIYEVSSPDDGYRILIDRLWPRGIKKEAASLDGWARTIAPSSELRSSFAHKPERFEEFRKSYRGELDRNPEAAAFVQSCEDELLSCNVTLLYAAKNETYNNAVVLSEWIRQHQERVREIKG